MISHNNQQSKYLGFTKTMHKFTGKKTWGIWDLLDNFANESKMGEGCNTINALTQRQVLSSLIDQ